MATDSIWTWILRFKNLLPLTFKLDVVASHQCLDVVQEFIDIWIVVKFLGDAKQTDCVDHWIGWFQWLFEHVVLKLKMIRVWKLDTIAQSWTYFQILTSFICMMCIKLYLSNRNWFWFCWNCDWYCAARQVAFTVFGFILSPSIATNLQFSSDWCWSFLSDGFCWGYFVNIWISQLAYNLQTLVQNWNVYDVWQKIAALKSVNIRMTVG